MSPAPTPTQERGQEHEQRRRERHVLLWMCVLIGVTQLGFGSVIPVLPLYAQSFDVSQSAIGATVAIYGLARFVIAMPTWPGGGQHWLLAAWFLHLAMPGVLWPAPISNYSWHVLRQASARAS
jgi:hypothetical protein